MIPVCIAHVQCVPHKLYFSTNDISSKKKAPIFITTIWAKSYALLQSLVTLTAQKDKLFEEVLLVHFEPKAIRTTEVFFQV